MADIVSAAGSTLKSTTAENALLESAMYVQKLERTSANNPNNRNFVNVQFNTDAGTATITATIPVTQAIDPASGGISLVAEEYLV